MQYLNSTELTMHMRNSIKEYLNDRDNPRVAAVVMHLYTRMNPCERCSFMLFRECEREHGIGGSLRRFIAEQQQHEPRFSLLVSFKDIYQGTIFWGKDENSTLADLPLDAERPFYPVVHLPIEAAEEAWMERPICCDPPEARILAHRARLAELEHQDGGDDETAARA